MMAAAAGVGFLLIYALAVAVGLPANLATMTTVFAAMGLPSVIVGIRALASGLAQGAPIFREMATAANFGDHRRIGKSLFALVRGRPDILIVDNLDRATVEQQRAFLRSLRRHRRYLPPVVLVAFDETPLTLADPDPEAPQELMAKIFTTVVRLYPMTEADVLAILGHLYDLLERTPDTALGAPWRFLRFPAVAGDLARILLAHRKHSVRFCYQFLNIAATTSVTLGLVHPADFSALLRLQGLFEFLPWIRHDPNALADILTDNDSDALMAYAAGILGREKLSSELDLTVRRYLALTNHMQPYFADWHTFTGRFARAPEEVPAQAAAAGGSKRPRDNDIWFGEPKSLHGVAPERERAFVLMWAAIDLKLAAEQNVARRREFYGALIPDPRSWLSQTATEILSPALAQTLASEDYSGSEFLLIFIFLQQRLWLADTGAAHRPLPHDVTDVPDLLILAGSDEEAANSVDEMQPLLADPAVRNAFIQITRAAGLATVPFFHAVVAASSFGSDDLVRPSGGERRRLQRLERLSAIRSAGPLPLLFRTSLDPIRRARHVTTLLERFDILDIPATVSWDQVIGRADILGRLERADCNGLFEGLRPFFAAAALAARDDRFVQQKLLETMAAALPAFDANNDGVWRNRAFEPFAPIAATLLDPTRKSASIELLRALSGSPITAHLLLMLLQFDKVRSGNLEGASDYLDAVIHKWNPNFPWPESYIECVIELLNLAQDGAVPDPAPALLGHWRMKELWDHAIRSRADNDLISGIEQVDG